MSPPKLGRFVGRSKTHRTYVPVFCWAVVFFSSFFCHGEIWGRPNFREKFQHLGEFYFSGLPSLKLVRTRKKWMVKRRGIRLPFLGPDTAYLFRWVNSLLVSGSVWWPRLTSPACRCRENLTPTQATARCDASGVKVRQKKSWVSWWCRVNQIP